MKAAVLYLTHNRFEYTKQSLNSIINNTDRDKYDLLLWDNLTTEAGMLDWMKKTCEDNSFNYVFCKNNVGLTTAMNQQMRIMNKKNYDVFCHIANDVVVSEKWLEAVFTVVGDDRVGLVGHDFEPDRVFESTKIKDIELEKLFPECNVGGMHFCIPKKVYDLIGGFQHVEFGYGQQDANYSIKVKLLPNDWWVYYLHKNVYKAVHLGVTNNLILDHKNKDKELYGKYHNEMRQRLRNSGGDVSGGRSFRTHLTHARRKYDTKKISYEDLLRAYRVDESMYKTVKQNQILDTNIDIGNFE